MNPLTYIFTILGAMLIYVAFAFFMIDIKRKREIADAVITVNKSDTVIDIPYYNPLDRKCWKENRNFTAELGDGSKIKGMAVWNKKGECFLLFNAIIGEWGYRNNEWSGQMEIANFFGYQHHWPYPSNYARNVIFVEN